MPSPQKKKRGKSNGTRAKRSKTASTPTRPRKKKSNKRGPYRQFSKAEKDIRDALIENAAKSIIKARANNPKNKPGEKPRVPRGLYKEKADGINQVTKGLEVTVNDLENKVRSIDKATNAVASTQPTVAASTDATVTSSYPACSASDLNTVSDSDILMKILTSDSDDNANAAGKIKISPSDSDTASDSDISPRRLESTLNAAAASTSSSSIPPPPPPHLPPIPLPSRSPHIDQSTATASLSEMNPLPSEPISSSYIMDNSQAVPQSSIDQLSYPMREAPRLNPGVEGYVYEAGQIVISHPRKPSLSLTQGDYSRLNANVWLCDATIDFFGQGVVMECSKRRFGTKFAGENRGRNPNSMQLNESRGKNSGIYAWRWNK